MYSWKTIEKSSASNGLNFKPALSTIAMPDGSVIMNPFGLYQAEDSDLFFLPHIMVDPRLKLIPVSEQFFSERSIAHDAVLVEFLFGAVSETPGQRFQAYTPHIRELEIDERDLAAVPSP
jgi:hypothetical protein